MWLTFSRCHFKRLLTINIHDMAETYSLTFLQEGAISEPHENLGSELRAGLRPHGQPGLPVRQRALSFPAQSGCAKPGLKSGKIRFRYSEKRAQQWAISPPCMTGFFILADLVLALLPASSALTHMVTHLRVQEGKYYTQRFFLVAY